MVKKRRTNSDSGTQVLTPEEIEEVLREAHEQLSALSSHLDTRIKQRGFIGPSLYAFSQALVEVKKLLKLKTDINDYTLLGYSVLWAGLTLDDREAGTLEAEIAELAAFILDEDFGADEVASNDVDYSPLLVDPDLVAIGDRCSRSILEIRKKLDRVNLMTRIANTLRSPISTTTNKSTVDTAEPEISPHEPPPAYDTACAASKFRTGVETPSETPAHPRSKAQEASKPSPSPVEVVPRGDT